MAYARRGILIRVIYLLVASLGRLCTAGGRRWRRAGDITLCYHGVHQAQAARFKRQMQYLARHPQLQVEITFDDAFANLLEHALPALDEFGLSATIFVVTGQPGVPPRWSIAPNHPDARERTMSQDELRTLARAGRHRIGSHTVSHRDLTRLSDQELKRELCDSKHAIEALINGGDSSSQVEELACPHGAFDDRVLRAAEAAGYQRIHTLDPACAAKLERAETGGRMSMSPEVWWCEFVLTVHGMYAWLPRLRRVARAIAPALSRRSASRSVTPQHAGAILH